SLNFSTNTIFSLLCLRHLSAQCTRLLSSLAAALRMLLDVLAERTFNPPLSNAPTTLVAHMLVFARAVELNAPKRHVFVSNFHGFCRRLGFGLAYFHQHELSYVLPLVMRRAVTDDWSRILPSFLFLCFLSRCTTLRTHRNRRRKYASSASENLNSISRCLSNSVTGLTCWHELL